MNAVDTALTVMDALRVCLTAQLAPVCGGVALIPGQQAYPDSCGCGNDGCGQAWVRLDSLYPSKQFPVQDISPTNCGSPLAAVIEVGVLRCVPTLTAGGTPPTVVALTQAAIDAAADTSAMLEALACCPEVQERPHILGRYAARDAGDCGGGVWTITVQMMRR